MATEGTQYQKKQYLFTGEWIPDQDPLKIGEANFATLQNCRYADTGLEGILGYSKINTTAIATYLKGRAGIHLQSPYSGQSRVLVQGKNAAETDGQILENTTAIPSQGDFAATALHTDSSGASKGRFSRWPAGHVAYCNEVESILYAGNELRCAGCKVYAPSGDFKYDYASVVQNMERDAANVATLHRVSEALDANTMLLLHLDNNVTDSSPATIHTVTNTNCTFSALTKVFGTHSLVLNGTTARLSVPDNADFDFSGGTFTIDLRIRLDALPGAGKTWMLYYQGTDANNYFGFYVDENGALGVTIFDTGAEILNAAAGFKTGNGVIAAATWYHVELVESGDEWRIFVNGVQQGYLSDAGRAADYTGVVYIGYDGASGAGYWFDGYIDEYRVSNSARHTGAFEPPSAAYGSSTYRTYLYIGATRPIKAIKAYVGRDNTTAGSLNVEYWNGSSWASVSTLVDGTALLGVPLAQTGTISFSTTVTLAKVKSIDAIVLYWYRVTITECDAATTLYHISVDAPMQAVTDLWDGIYRTAISVQKYSTAYSDYTTNVAEEDYSSVNTATFANLNSLAAANYVVMGFQDPTMGVTVTMVAAAANVNATVLGVYYWDGDDWVSVGIVEDGTVSGNASLGKSGTITWNPPTHNTEFTTEISKRGALYYYKFQWSNAFSGSVSVDYVGGITSPRKLSGGYIFPFMFAGHPMLCGYKAGKEGNRVDYGSSYTTEVWNGQDTSDGYGGSIYFGGSEDLTAATEVFNRFGANVYNVAIFTKASEVFLLDGYGPDTWRVYQISSGLGCPAPMTMDTAEVAWGIGGEATRNIAIWLSYSGPIVFDAAVLVPYKNRISSYFDQTQTDAIDLTKIDESVGWTDSNYYEYNLIIPLKDGTWKWLCLDLIKKRWFEKLPQAAAEAYPKAAFRVTDTNGTSYAYALRDNGYMMRLENGTTWDGAGITQTVKTGKQNFTGHIFDITQIERLKIVTTGITEAGVDLTVSHYKDNEVVATTMGTMATAGTGYLRKTFQGGRPYKAWCHQIQFSVTTSATSKGVPLLGYAVKYQLVREEIRDAA